MSQTTTYAWTIAAVLDVDEINGTLTTNEELLDITVALSSEVVTFSTDYEELENKPQINGHTLIGDKSASDLGLVSAVAGKGLSTNDYDNAEKAKVAAADAAKHTHVNKAVLDAITSAPYTKPSAGIPKSDLASEVQTSLNKADSALQSHQSLEEYRKAADQDIIDATKLSDAPSDNKQYARKNGAWAEVQGGGGEPAAYIKNASVADEKLTLTKKDNTTVELDVSGKADAEDIPTKTSDLTNDSGFLTEHQSLAEYRKASAQNVIDAGKQAIIADLDTIRSGAAAGATAVQPEAGKGLFSGNYDDLSNKPTIPSKTSDLTNDSGFITKSVSDLVNYYLKSETYTKSEVQSLIAAIKQFSYEVVAVLPTASASTMHKIYLVPSASQTAQNVKDEYITIDNGSGAATRYTWEQIGSTSIDLSNYVTITQLNTALANYTTTAALTTLLAGKQDTISDLAAIRSGAALGATAIQQHQSLAAYRTSADQDTIDSGKVDKVSGKGLSTNDYTTAEKTKLAGLENYDDTALSGRVTAAEGSISTHVAATNNPHSVTKAQVGLGNVDNTSDIEKPISTATQTALDAKLSDAPSDNKQYARKNGTWTEVQGGGGGGTGDHTQLTNRDAANQHPISAITGLQSALDGKQGTVADLDTIRSGAALGATALQSVPNTYRKAAAQDVIDAGKYTKPTSGIPESDLASGVTTKLNATKVTDVQMGGQSIVTNEVATIPTATTISTQSTDSQIPTAKAVYDIVGDIESLLAAL